MAQTRVKLQFMCDDCGSVTTKWTGRCGSCGEWNTVREIKEPSGVVTVEPATELLERITVNEVDKIKTCVDDLDRVLGGGIVNGSVMLLGGEPGAGKSTLSLQIANAVGTTQTPAIVVSGEESTSQVASRARRLGVNGAGISLACETNVHAIVSLIRSHRPQLLVIDSVQTLTHPDLASAAGSVACVRECTAELANAAKAQDVSVLLIGHLTKDGNLAGPRTLEHMVDVVLTLDGNRHHDLRLLRATKNRYGNTGELAAFSHTERGLEVVEDPSALLLSDRHASQPGSALAILVDGRQPFAVELQALAARSFLPSPRRGVDGGLDQQRLLRLLAVLEQHGGVAMHDVDVFASSVGDLACDDPGIDLGLLAALASARRGVAIPESAVVIGEVGLGGDVRAVSQMPARLKAASRLGFRKAIVPAGTKPEPGIELLSVTTVAEALRAIAASSSQKDAIAV